MKKLLITFTMICAAVSAVLAQAPTTAFDVDGIKVIFKPTVKDVINVRVFFRGGVSNYPASQAGIEAFALSALAECGTKKYTADAFKNLADNYSIGIGADDTYDYGGVELQCVFKYFDYGWDLFSDAIVNPAFNPADVDMLRGKLITVHRESESDPDKRSAQLIIENAFAGTPYEKNPDGSEETLRKITATDLKNYYQTILNKNQIFIVVAGRISKTELIAKIHASFGNLPSWPYQQPYLKTPLFTDYKVLVEKRDLQTNYLTAIMNSPPVYSPQYVPFRLGISVLGGSLFGTLRTDLNLGYDPTADTYMRRMPYATMSISTTQPKQAVHEMVNTLNTVRNYEVSENGLKQLKASYITTSYITQQSTSAITGALGEAEIFGGWETEEQLPELVNKVTIEDIGDALLRYIVGLRWSYLGTADGAAAADSAFKEKLSVPAGQ